jgi:transcriptional regulator with XRE-family HTH domain
METPSGMNDTTDFKLAQRLKALRSERGWSLDDLAARAEVSRATLSRLEKAEVSPTANVLGKLCAAYGLTVSRLMYLVESDFAPLLSREAQTVWRDPHIGFRRRSVSPPAQSLAGEVIECELDPDTHIHYAQTPRPGLEHHLHMLEGRLRLDIGDATYDLRPGDTLRYQLYGASRFTTPKKSGARYFLFIL